MKIINNSRRSQPPELLVSPARLGCRSYASQFEHNSNITRPIPISSKESMR
jgi:hypothetical protein